MGEVGIINLSSDLSEDKKESLCSMLFGVSCALYALKHLPDPQMNGNYYSDISNRLLKGSAQLLGLLTWRVQNLEAKSGIFRKLNNAERDIEELKIRRKEDAKANEKVVGIYASQEQVWFSERKRLRQHIGALLNELRVILTKSDQSISELNEKLNEKEGTLKQEEVKRGELEAKVKESENVIEELKENMKKEAQEHFSEIWKNKSAFIELVSNQRQLEAEMGRALKQAENSKKELELALEQKNEALIMAHNISLEMVKMRKDLDQKDKILSAMLRKLKLDSAEKNMLLNELKLSKTKKKQIESEKAVSETRNERRSFKSMLSKHTSFKFYSDLEENSQTRRSRSVPNGFLLEYDHQFEHQNDLQNSSPTYDRYSHEGSGDLMFGADIKHLESWVRSEAEKYSNLVDQRHHLEINAFSEQLRLKDERLEGLRWRLLSMDLESKRFQSHIEGLNNDISQLRQENMKLGTLVLEKEAEISSLKRPYSLKSESKNKNDTDSVPSSPNLASSPETIWSNVKIIKKKLEAKEKEEEEDEPSSTSRSRDIILNVQSPEKEFDEEKDVVLDTGSIRDIYASTSTNKFQIDEKESSSKNLSKSTVLPWKMDLHALGVSYKIKRLKQQLLMLERFTGKQKTGEYIEGNDGSKVEMKGFYVLMALLNKQVTRYQSLEEKIDELCKRMNEKGLELSPGDYRIAKSKNETRTLENYLEETFQLQRYIVASGQKLMELQSKIISGFIDIVEGLDGPASFDMKRFGDSVGIIFKEVQRGLEVRIARIIGDLEGTLACDGIIHLRK